MRRGSVRLRLAAATTLIAAAALALLTLIVVMQVSDASRSSAVALARTDLQPYAADLRNQHEESPDLPASGVLVLIEAPGGVIRRVSMPSALAAQVRAVTGTSVVGTATGRFAVVARTVPTSTGTWHLWAARDLTASDAVLAGIATTMLVGAPIAALVTGVAAWLVASAALRPVERLRAAAERLRGASGRLPEEGGAELAQLGATLNGLIVSLRESVAHERRLTADAAHELRTPLAVLAAQVELAARHPERAAVADVRASVDRLIRLTDSLLALSRTETEGEATGESTVGQLVTESMDAVDRARLLAPAGVAIDLELDHELDETAVLRIDATGFGRILTNLVQNALAAGPASAVDVRLEADGGALRLIVEDDGPGLAGEFLPFAFDRFARSERTRGSGSGGAGLGLALVRALAERAGGSATLGNRSGRGAVAVVRLPVAAGDVVRRPDVDRARAAPQPPRR